MVQLVRHLHHILRDMSLGEKYRYNFRQVWMEEIAENRGPVQAVRESAEEVTLKQT